MITSDRKNMSMNNIKIGYRFSQTTPNKSKIDKNIRVYRLCNNFETPIVLNESLKLIDGYSAYLAAKKLELEEVKVIIVGDTQTKSDVKAPFDWIDFLKGESGVMCFTDRDQREFMKLCEQHIDFKGFKNSRKLFNCWNKHRYIVCYTVNVYGNIDLEQSDIYKGLGYSLYTFKDVKAVSKYRYRYRAA